ncbi:MAG: hypothetical protein ACI837_003178 [Crocinitomicaceae bacterium]|jgi:hypothetical protein
MKDFFGGMTSLEQAFWIIALVGSLIFIGILVMSLFGGGDSDMDSDMAELEDGDGGGFQFFTFKNIMAFFTIFGWTGVTCIDNGLAPTLSIIIASVAGLIMMTLTSLLFFWMNKLAQSGTMDISKAIGNIGEVYLPIGANRSNIGKIHLKVQGSLRELEAITDADEDLKTSSLIKVLEVISDELLLVEKLTK